MFHSIKTAAVLDRFAIGLSALCAIHCVATVVLLGMVSSLSALFAAPIIHEGGLMLAILIGALALGAGVRRHRLIWPSVIGVTGLGLMGLALTVPHGSGEAVLTIAGVSLVALAHFVNIRADCRCGGRCDVRGAEPDAA